MTYLFTALLRLLFSVLLLLLLSLLFFSLVHMECICVSAAFVEYAVRMCVRAFIRSRLFFIVSYYCLFQFCYLLLAFFHFHFLCDFLPLSFSTSFSHSPILTCTFNGIHFPLKNLDTVHMHPKKRKKYEEEKSSQMMKKRHATQREAKMKTSVYELTIRINFDE